MFIRDGTPSGFCIKRFGIELFFIVIKFKFFYFWASRKKEIRPNIGIEDVRKFEPVYVSKMIKLP